MSEELQKPPVIDFEAMFQPISEENPAGESLRYSGIYDQIAEARRADDTMNQGDWKTDIKYADYRQVINLAVPALTSQSKDLQIAAYLSEGLSSVHGFAGLRDSLKLMSGLQETFWETLHPEVDEGDMEGRANAISWLETPVFTLLIKKIPIIDGAGYNYLDCEDSKKFDIPENLETLLSADEQRYRELQAQAERESRVTGELWRKAKSNTRRAFCEQINFTIEECWTEYNDLNRVIEEKFDRNQAPGLSGLKKTLEDIHTQVKLLLEEKRKEEPDPVEAFEEENAGDGATVTGETGARTGAIQTRADALKRLSDVADYFQRAEPHSPVSYLVARAVKWGNMPLENWLQDVIKDDSVLSNLRQTLGFNTGTDGESSSY